MKIIGWVDKQTGNKYYTLDRCVGKLRELAQLCGMVSAAFVGIRDAFANLANIKVDTTH